MKQGTRAAVGCVFGLVYLAFWVGVAYVIFHFIRKYW